MAAVVGRLAPSPTGLLHIGNVRSLVLAWLGARSVSGQIYLRIEDLLPDMGHHVAPLLDDLRWLGLDWDEPAAPSPLWTPERWPQGPADRARLCVQSHREPVYRAVVAALVKAGLVYPCVCTRKDIDLAARAPHQEDRGQAYPGTCRDRFANVQAALAWEQDRAQREGRPPLGVALRLRVPDTPMQFVDLLHGPQSVWLPGDSGDIVIVRKDGGFAYMLAVVIDDVAMGVTQVVRGDDLLEVTGQQLAVYDALRQVAQLPFALEEPALVPFWQRAGHWQPPQHVHVPLVLGDDGRRLAKRNQSVHLHQLREAGVAPEAVLAWVAESIGIGGTCDLADMAARFDWHQLPNRPVHFGEQARMALGGL